MPSHDSAFFEGVTTTARYPDHGHRTDEYEKPTWKRRLQKHGLQGDLCSVFKNSPDLKKKKIKRTWKTSFMQNWFSYRNKFGKKRLEICLKWCIQKMFVWTSVNLMVFKRESCSIFKVFRIPLISAAVTKWHILYMLVLWPIFILAKGGLCKNIM